MACSLTFMPVFRLKETMDEPPPSTASNIILQSTSSPVSHRRNSSESRVFRMLRAPRSQIALRRRNGQTGASRTPSTPGTPQRKLPQARAAAAAAPAAALSKVDKPVAQEPKDDPMSDMLSSMVDSYLQVSGNTIKEPTRKRRHLTTPGQVSNETHADGVSQEDSMDVDEYVYDIYYRESHVQTQERSGIVGLM